MSAGCPAAPSGGLKAIAAMAENRVIGAGGAIPWRLPEDFRWFKRTTLGHVVVMGRRTFASLPGPLPGRVNVVVTTGPTLDGVISVRSPDLVRAEDWRGEVFVIGGEQIYRQMLPRCDELLISHVRMRVEGDAFFPPFEEEFEWVGTPFEAEGFEVRRYLRKGATGCPVSPGPGR
jgi:dihydrofolate reductase